MLTLSSEGYARSSLLRISRSGEANGLLPGGQSPPGIKAGNMPGGTGIQHVDVLDDHDHTWTGWTITITEGGQWENAAETDSAASMSICYW
jgi:hypothetical protein